MLYEIYIMITHVNILAAYIEVHRYFFNEIYLCDTSGYFCNYTLQVGSSTARVRIHVRQV